MAETYSKDRNFSEKFFYGFDSIIYWCRVARPYLTEGLDLLVDMLKSSLFDPEEFDRERLFVGWRGNGYTEDACWLLADLDIVCKLSSWE